MARLIKVKDPKKPGDYLMLAEADFKPPWERFEEGGDVVVQVEAGTMGNDLGPYDLPERATPVRGGPRRGVSRCGRHALHDQRDRSGPGGEQLCHDR
jgi:hypothetical protein